MNTENWNIEIEPVPQTMDLLKSTMKHCWGVDSRMNLDRLFACNDSILEIPEYWLRAKAPRSVAAQLRTHEKRNGVYFWMGTGRPDRPDRVSGEYSREQIVPFCMKLTARAIKEISHQRLCRKAEETTRVFWSLVKEQMALVEPALAKEMVPLCVYRGGICTEFGSCKGAKK